MFRKGDIVRGSSESDMHYKLTRSNAKMVVVDIDRYLVSVKILSINGPTWGQSSYDKYYYNNQVFIIDKDFIVKYSPNKSLKELPLCA